MGVLSINGPSPMSRLLSGRSRGSRGFDTQGSNARDNLNAGEAYVANLARLIPGEIIAMYSLLKQVPPPTGWAATHIIPFFAAFVLIVLRALATRDKGRTRWGLVLLSLATFICWVYVEGDWFWTWKLNELGLYISHISLLVLAFLAPALVGER